MKKYLLPALIALIGTAAIAFGQTAGKQIEVFLGPSIGKQWVSVASCIDSSNLWTCVGGSGSTPGGSNGQIQYNNSGSFGGTTTATGVLTMLGNTINGASGPIGVITPTNGNCVVGNGTSWTSTTCPGGGGLNQLTGDVTAGPGTGSQAATLANTAVTPGSYTSANITVDSKGRLTAAANGSGGGGSLSVSTTGGSTVTGVTSITFPATIAVSGTTPNAIASPFTPVDDCQSGTCGTSGSAAISVDDAGSLILLGAHTYTIAQAGTGGFDAGWLPAGVMCVTGPCVLTSTTSTFSPASGTTTLTMATGEIAFMRSNGSIYRTTLAANGSTVVYPSNANTFTGAQTFGETHGTTYAPTLTSNNYTATSSDCGKTLLMPTGTTPTLTLPNLNASCTIVAVQNSAVQFTPTAASGGSVVSVNSYTKSKAQNAILFLTIITPSSSAATWALAGDGA